MRILTVALGLAALALVSGCESDEHHHHRDRDDRYRGGAYSSPEYPVYGNGAYGDPRYPDYDRDRGYRR